MVSMTLEGYSQRFIGMCYGCSKSGVASVVKKFVEKGTVSRIAGSGRKRKTTKRVDKMIVKEVRKNRKVSSHAIKKDLALHYLSVWTFDAE